MKYSEAFLTVLQSGEPVNQILIVFFILFFGIKNNLATYVYICTITHVIRIKEI